MSNSKDASPIRDQDIEIKEIPDINVYDDIIKAAKTGRLIIFVGAGVSKLIGLPLWKEFAHKRLDEIFEHGLIDYRTYCGLKEEEPKKLLTICKMFMAENGITSQPAKEIFKIKDEYYKKYKDVYGKLYSMRAIYVTTNYDECLDNFALNIVEDEDITAESSAYSNDSSRMTVKLKSPEGEIVINQSDLLESKLQNGNVIHIHGSVNDENNMIVTLNDYMLHYGSLSKDNHPELSIFLDRIFNTKYVVLFIGYGLEEYEILEYMLSKVKNPEKTRKHYMLYACFKEDKKLVSLLRKYYLGFGVELIPYDIGKKGYDQLITIIDKWSKVLNKLSNEQDYIQKMQFIDEVIEDRSPKFNINAKAVIEMAKEDESLEKYLFRKISDIRWLDLLIENGFYKPERVPNAIDKGDGYYSIPYWANVDYLNKLLSNTENLNKEVISKILNIIQEISLYKDSEGNAIDNYHVWSQLTDIISKIPNEYITNEVLELTRAWTKSRFNIDFVVEKIGEILLDKFLNSDNPDDFKKVQIIIDIVTEVNEDKKTLVIGSHYFKKLFDKKTVELIARKCSIDFIKSYLNRVTEVLFKGVSRNTIKYGNEEFLIKLEDDRQKYIISVLQTDKEAVTSIFLNQNYDRCKVLFEKEIAYCNDNDFTKHVLNWLYEILDESKFESNLHAKVRNLYYGLYSKCSYYSLYASYNMYNSDADELLLHFYKDIITNKFQAENVEEDKIIFLNNLLNNRYFALIKVALYVIGNLPDKYLTVILNNLDSEIMQLIIQESYFGDELRVILENINANEIDTEHISKILRLIECGPYSKYSSLEFDDTYKKVWKIKRLNALRHIPYFIEYISKNFQEVNSNIKLGPVIGEVHTTWSTEKTPLNQDDLTKMTNEELSDFLSTFKTEDIWEGSTVGGLGRTLSEHVKNNPEKYDSNLLPFLNSAYFYIYEIFYGFLNAWREKKFINWNNILDFMLRYIDRDEFWNDTFIIDDSDWKANHNWTIGVFADLICEGTQDDKWAMGYDQVKKSKNLVLLILDRVSNYDERDENNDYIAYILNSIRGRVLKALLYISLYLKRNSTKENRKETKWDNDLHTMFIRYMDSYVLDAYILFGMYLPQFIFLDKQWSKDKVNNITYENRNWEGFMVGYIYSRPIYKDVYILMKNHYKHSIYHTFKEEVIENVAQHIAVGYLNGLEEDINNELFDSVIEKWDYKMISKILWYFWTYDDKLSNYDEDEDKERIPKQDAERIRLKIIAFWNVLYRKYKDINSQELNDDDKKLISDSIKLIGILENLDEESVNRIRFAIPYSEVNHNAYYFIEKINKFASDRDSAEKRLTIGQLLLDMVKYNIPTYPEDEIIKLVEYLYEIKDENVKECADSICNIYAKHNIEFLRDICLEHRDF